MQMKIELILLQSGAGMLYHSDSRETKEIKIDKKNSVPEALKYIEEYCTKAGFDLLSPEYGQFGIHFTLVKK
jgi:hypothetical protein